MLYLPGFFIDAFAVLGALFALWRGGPAERTAAVIVIANAVIGEGAHWLIPASENLVRMGNDGLTALALLAVTVRYAALWMGGVMLFFAAQFTMHSYYLVTGRATGDYLYALINNINFIGVTWCLIIGSVVAWRRRIHRERPASPPAA